MTVAISFCNEERSFEKGIYLFDEATQRGAWVPVTYHESIMGTRGMCSTGERLYALYTVGWKETRLATYGIAGASLQLFEDQPLREVDDPHSMCIHDDRLVIASTGKDSILAYDMSRGGVSSKAEIMWKASSAESDTHHVNSVCSDGARLLASAFGPKTGDFWSTAHRGYIVDVLSNEILRSDLFHPHTLQERAGQIIVLESGLQRIHIGDKTLAISGYLRGLEYRDDTIMVGSNAAREISRQRGIIVNANNVENVDETIPRACNIVIANASDGTIISKYDMAAIGREIYDIISIA